MVPRDVLTVFPPDDPAALFVASICMASNDIEDALGEIGAANPGEIDYPDLTHRSRFSYRVRLLMGHLYEGIVALKAWRQSEPDVRQLLDGLSSDGKKALKLVMGLEQRIGQRALDAVRQNSFHYPHPDPKRCPDSTVGLAETIRINADLEAGIDLGDDARATFRFADQLALGLALSGHDETQAGQQLLAIREAARGFLSLVVEICLIYCREREIGFDVIDK